MRWLAERDLAAPGVRLFCLPHAGSGAAGFYRWKRELAGDVAVCPVMLPGREARLPEAPMKRVGEIVAELHDEARGVLAERPYAIYGHSMSALLAFEWARRIERDGLPGPRCLMVAGRNAPQVVGGHRVFHQMGDEEMVAALVEKYGGDAAVILQDADLREVFLPILRADLEVVETYAFAPGPALKCAVRAYAGVADGSVSEEGLAAWEATTVGGFVGRRVVGDHFFHFGVGQEWMLDEVRRVVSG